MTTTGAVPDPVGATGAGAGAGAIDGTLSRRGALSVLGFALLTPVALNTDLRASDPTAAPGTRTRSATPVMVNAEHYDVRKSGAKCDGITDDTKAWKNAVSTVAKAGGGKIWWRGISIASQIRLDDKVGLLGLGPEVSTVKHKPGRAEGQHLVLLDQPDARGVTLQDLSIDGNRSKQEGLASAVYFDNSNGEGVLARHAIRNVHVRNVAGTGIFWGYRMRSSLIDGVVIYYCDEYGLRANVFSDNTMQNVDVGQSGSHGIYLTNCSNSKFSNLKSWYSGRVKPGGAGIYQRNGSTNVYSNILTQENSGSGMVMYGADSPIIGVVVRGLNSDSDNSEGSTSNYGLSMRNVRDSLFDLTITSQAPLKARPYAGVGISESKGNKITANIDSSAVVWKVTGTAIGDNVIDLGRGLDEVQGSDSEFSPMVYLHRAAEIKLVRDIAIKAPVTPKDQPPVGLRYGFALIQNGSGGHKVDFASAFKMPSSAKLDTSPNTRTNIQFECDSGGSWTMIEFTTGIPTR